jgi:hypothetical protein
MTNLIIRYPWSQLSRGQGFFVPSLDPEKTKEEGLRAAVYVRRFDAKARVGVLNGRLGVLFTVAPPLRAAGQQTSQS